MSEWLDILREWASVGAESHACLVTVVEILGSTYRRPGARLLIADGRAYGSVSGGCVEADLILTAWSRTEAGAVVCTFDTRSEEAWGYGLGCKGVVTVLIQRVEPNDEALSAIRECVHRRAAATIAIRLDGAKCGEWISDADHVTQLESLLPLGQDAGCVHEVEGLVYVEKLRPRVGLKVFGAGYDAEPLVRLGMVLGWQVDVYDHRATQLDPARFSGAELHLLAPMAEIDRDWDGRTAVVVMSHHYEQDRRVLDVALGLTPGYIGVLGPRSRTENLLQDLERLDQLERLHSPTGLDIGAESPDEIGLSICAEVQAKLSQRAGGFLKNRTRSIHQVAGEQ